MACAAVPRARRWDLLLSPENGAMAIALVLQIVIAAVTLAKKVHAAALVEAARPGAPSANAATATTT
jgi:hypothetical protein